MVVGEVLYRELDCRGHMIPVSFIYFSSEACAVDGDVARPPVARDTQSKKESKEERKQRKWERRGQCLAEGTREVWLRSFLGVRLKVVSHFGIPPVWTDSST